MTRCKSRRHFLELHKTVLSLEASINELNNQLNERKEKVSQLDIQVILNYVT